MNALKFTKLEELAGRDVAFIRRHKGVEVERVEIPAVEISARADLVARLPARYHAAAERMQKKARQSEIRCSMSFAGPTTAANDATGEKVQRWSNWTVPHRMHGYWHAAVARGHRRFDEVLAVAHEDPELAAQIVVWAVGSRDFLMGRGDEEGFVAAVARLAIEGYIGRKITTDDIAFERDPHIRWPQEWANNPGESVEP